jgi:hypothetical protein
MLPCRIEIIVFVHFCWKIKKAEILIINYSIYYARIDFHICQNLDDFYDLCFGFRAIVYVRGPQLFDFSVPLIKQYEKQIPHLTRIICVSHIDFLAGLTSLYYSI